MPRPTLGARRRRFVLELPQAQPDGFGGTTTSFSPGPELWGAIELVSQDERMRAGRPESAATHRVRLRYRDGVSGAMRLTSGLRRFAIRSCADPDGRRRDLVCLVEEVTP